MVHSSVYYLLYMKLIGIHSRESEKGSERHGPSLCLLTSLYESDRNPLERIREGEQTAWIVALFINFSTVYGADRSPLERIREGLRTEWIIAIFLSSLHGALWQDPLLCILCSLR